MFSSFSSQGQPLVCVPFLRWTHRNPQTLYVFADRLPLTLLGWRLLCGNTRQLVPEELQLSSVFWLCPEESQFLSPLTQRNVRAQRGSRFMWEKWFGRDTEVFPIKATCKRQMYKTETGRHFVNGPGILSWGVVPALWLLHTGVFSFLSNDLHLFLSLSIFPWSNSLFRDTKTWKPQWVPYGFQFRSVTTSFI